MQGDSILASKLLVIICLGMACASVHAADPTASPPAVGWVFDRAGADLTTKPGDNFFRYANGAWLDRTPIAADQSEASMLQAMSDRTDQRIRGILERAALHGGHQPTSLEGKVGAFYRSFMDEARLEALGFTPIAPQLDAVRHAVTHDALAALMGRNNTDFDGALFSLSIDADLKDPKHYAVYVDQAGLGLPDRDYYLKPEFARQKAAYETYVARLLTLIQWPHPDFAAKNVVAFETAVAKVSWSEAEQRDTVASYQPMSVAELNRLAPGFAWSGYLGTAGLSDLPRIVVNQKSAFPKLASVYAHTTVTTIQAWQATRIADNAAFYLSRPFQDANFEMQGKTLAGQQQPSARWRRGVRAVSGGDCPGDRVDCFGNLMWGVGQLYTAQYFPPSAKTDIERLVANLKAAYQARIEKLDWMSSTTKQEALHKLATYTIKVGYPDRARDYSQVMVRDDDLVGNVMRAATADWEFYVGRLRGPVDGSDWSTTTQTIDAYSGTLHDIVFPAGILQPPMFDPHADPAVNYGAIGAFVGHELTHGFDDEGRKIDADGALRNWWLPADARAFEKRASKLGAQYSAYEPLPGVHINGELTMGENIADLGGLTLALDAYHRSLQGQPAPLIDGFSGDQRLFLGWAQIWRGKVTDDAVRGNVTSDPHSPFAFRVNGTVRNIDAWYEAFGIQPGDKLYLAPESRVRIW
jgi:putative endopeptidase